jgi:hypothetical protein
MLRRIVRPKREEVTEGWRKLLNVELHNTHPSLDILEIKR